MSGKYSSPARARFPILWLTGNTGAGKSTLAFGIQGHFDRQNAASSALARRIVVLDGDEMRQSISREDGFSPDDRRKHNIRVARLATVLQKQGLLVLVAVIAPFAAVRKEIDLLCAPRWIYVKRSGLEAPDRPYESPLQPSLTIDCDMLSVEEARQTLIAWLNRSDSGEAVFEDEPVELVKNR